MEDDREAETFIRASIWEEDRREDGSGTEGSGAVMIVGVGAKVVPRIALNLIEALLSKRPR